MATLEVHDGQGRVEYVAVTPDKPVWIGSDPSKCGIVLRGPGVLPVHARLRWKETRYRIEATPEAKGVLVNGRGMLASSVREGDEVKIGPCLLYISGVESPPAGSVDPGARAQKAPPAQARAAAVPPRLKSGQAAPSTDWRKLDEPPPPTIQKTIVAQVVSPPGAAPAKTKKNRPIAPGQPAETPGSAAPGGTPFDPNAAKPTPVVIEQLKKLWRVLLVGDQVPGQEDILRSPLVITLTMTFVVLVSVSLIIWKQLANARRERAYHQARETREKGDFVNAVAQIGGFIENYPTDNRVAEMRALLAMARVEKYGRGMSPLWDPAIEEATKFATEAEQDREDYRDYVEDVAEIVRSAAIAYADQAKGRAVPAGNRPLPPLRTAAASLKSAEGARDQMKAAEELHRRLTGANHEGLFKKGPYFAKKAEALAAIEKARFRLGLLEAMDKGLKAKSAERVYANRDRLVLRFPDQAKDPEVLRFLREANELLRKAVTFDPTSREAYTSPRQEPLGPATSLVLRSRTAGGFFPSSASPKGMVVYALADGFAYGLDGADGKPLWQVPVGLASPFVPKPIPSAEEPSALVFDSRSNELLRLDGRSGKLIWRLELGEPIHAPPLILGNQAAIAAPGGNFMVANLETGKLAGTLKLGRRLASASPIADEQGQYFLALADEANVFVMSREPLGCVSVVYNGHSAGSIPCAPARLGRYVVVAENHTLDACRWSVLLFDDQKGVLIPRQQIEHPGWTWETPPGAGSILWAVTDRGGVQAFAAGGYTELEPFKLITKTTAEAKSSGPAYARAPNERELFVSSSLSGRYDLNADSQAIRQRWTLQSAGPSQGPLQADDRLVVLTQQFQEGVGVALWGVDIDTGSPVWRTVLGVPWTVIPGADPKGNGLKTLLADGRPITIDRDQLASGGFIEQILPKPGEVQLPVGPLKRLETNGLTILVPEPHASHLLVREGNEPFRRVDLPSPLGTEPLIVGKDVLIPGEGGRAFLIDPKTGLSRIEPYVSPFDRNRPVRWKAPVTLDGDAIVLADESGLVRRMVRREKPTPRLSATAQVDLKHAIIADPASTGGAVVLATDDGKIHVLSGRDLSPVGITTLDAPRALGPIEAGGRVFVADSAGNVVAFGPQGQKLWTVSLQEPPPIVPPVVAKDLVLLLGREGKLLRRSLADGSGRPPLPLDIVASGDPRLVGSDVVIPVSPGSIRLLKPEAAQAGSAQAASTDRPKDKEGGGF